MLTFFAKTEVTKNNNDLLIHDVVDFDNQVPETNFKALFIRFTNLNYLSSIHG